MNIHIFKKITPSILSLVVGSMLTFLLTIFLVFLLLQLNIIYTYANRFVSDWNELEQITNQIIYLQVFSGSDLPKVREDWISATEQCLNSLNLLRQRSKSRLLDYRLKRKLNTTSEEFHRLKERLKKAQAAFEDLTYTLFGHSLFSKDDERTIFERFYKLRTSLALSDYEIYLSLDLLLNLLPFEYSEIDLNQELQEIIRSVREKTRRYLIIFPSIILACLCLLGIFFYHTMRRISQPLKSLSKSIEKVMANDFNISLPKSYLEELNTLNIGFSRIIDRIKDLIDMVLENEKEKYDAKYRALQYQINPHFLYNTLCSIRIAAFKNNDTEVSDMLLILSRYLKNMLSNPKEMALVKNEVENLHNYISLMKIRSHNSIDFSVNIDRGIDNLYIPKLIIQPLVENAIFHGLNDKINLKSDTAKIAINGYRKRDLYIEVYDNGLGIAQEEIEKIFQKKGDDGNVYSDRIGLANINERIKHKCGEMYGVRIDSRLDEYTKITLKLKAMKTGGR